MGVVLHARDGTEVLVDSEDAEDLLPLLAAGVALRIRSCRGRPNAILEERGPDGKRITLGLAKVILSAGPRDEAVCLNGDPLDCRRANWRLDHTGAIRVWNSRLLGVAAANRVGALAL